MTSDIPTAEAVTGGPPLGGAAGEAPPAHPDARAQADPAPEAPRSASAAARPPLRIALTILHLVAYGIVGFGVIGTLGGLIGAGVGLVFAAGVGLVVLVGAVYALYGVAWFEVQRVDGLYGLGVPSLRPVAARAPGFKGWIGALGRQSIDGRMWRALAGFLVASALGALAVFLVQAAVRGTVEVLVRGWSAAWALAVALLAAAAIVGLALLHRLIAVAIVRAGTRESELTEQVRATSRQREGAVRAADVERTRIERDLHDGVQPRLVSVGMTLGLAQQKIDEDPEGAKELIAEAHTSTKAAITELRQLARGIYASVLDDRGLDAALSALAARSHIPVSLDVRMSGRCSRDAEAAAYFAIAESLTNAAKHSRASECRVIVRQRDDGATLWARVEDNGIGGARVVPGGGLDGIVNRVVAAGGSTSLVSPQGGPTALEVSVPCAS